MPLLHLLAGPNGAGRSSYVHDVLVPATGLPFINADEIAAAHWPGGESERAYQAARITEAQRRERMAGGESFISETEFSHQRKVQLVSDAVESGYLVHLPVIIVPVELAVRRVFERMSRGGHSVPEDKIRDHYERLWGCVAEAIQVADVTHVLDNSRARTPFRLCAMFERGTLIGSPSWPVWGPAALRGGSSS